MAQATITKEEFWATLEKLGEEEVRNRLAIGDYGDSGWRRGLVKEWLRRKDQERSEATNLALRRAARSANTAAWIAAIAAIIAAICAIVSIAPAFSRLLPTF